MENTNDRVESLLACALGQSVATYLTDPTISEVRINATGELWINQLGHGKRRTGDIIDPEKVRQAIYTVAYSVQAVCHENFPTIAAELPGSGQRFQGILPPLVKNPTLVIRKKAVRIFTLKDLETQGVISAEQSESLTNCLLDRQNILVVGGTDTGKTTFTNALLDVVSSTKDRIIILEDTQELQCNAEDVVYLRSKDGVATLRDLVKVTLRMSPDRIVIGEVRGAEALDLLKAWNTGHGGGVSTVHASSAAKGLSRVEQLVEEAGVYHSKHLIADAINVVVYMEKVGTKRVVKEVLTVCGVENNKYQFKRVA